MSKAPVLGNILKLSTGTVIAKFLGASGQLLLAFWLAPDQFGYWAAASATTSLVSGLTNFGEVNGYLSGAVGGYAAARRATRFSNAILLIPCIGVAVVYIVVDKEMLAMLVLIIALTIPLSGENDLRYAAAVRHRLYRVAVRSQVGAALTKLAVGVGLAVVLRSAYAIALAILLSYILSNVMLRRAVRVAEAEKVVDAQLVARGKRVSWAVNSWMMTLPLQAGFFTAQFLASPALLGLYYLSYQVTLAVSGVISGPIAKVALSTLAEQDGPSRASQAYRLATFLGGGMLLLVSVAAAISPLAERFVSNTWIDALPATVILLASLPARIMTPVVDAYQQASNRWWRSTFFNLVDAVGTASCAFALVTGNVAVLATVLCAWKIVLCQTRTQTTLSMASGVGSSVEMGFAVVVGSALLVVGAWVMSAWSIPLALAAACVSAVWLVRSARASRLGSDQRQTADRT